jgi:hypothetical protein
MVINKPTAKFCCWRYNGLCYTHWLFWTKEVFFSLLRGQSFKACIFISNSNEAYTANRVQVVYTPSIGKASLLIFQLNSWRYREACFSFFREKSKETCWGRGSHSFFGSTLLQKALACIFCSIYPSVNTIIHGCLGQLVSNYCFQLTLVEKVHVRVTRKTSQFTRHYGEFKTNTECQ